MTIDEIIDEAIQRVGGESTLGHEVTSARRSLNLLFQDWTNRGVNMWKLDQVVVTLSTSVTTYTLNENVVDILNAVYRDATSLNDLAIERISHEDYLRLPNKGQTGRPYQYMVERDKDQPLVHVWPLPDSAGDFIVFWKIGRIEDANRLFQNADVPDRFLPALISGLAWYMSRNRQNVPLELRNQLKLEYQEEFDRAMEEDRDRAPIYIIPRVPGGN